tara:strand:+ start:96 stop:530 length:435 start_codon:yes stop_codon:yes gene_type:complete
MTKELLTYQEIADYCGVSIAQVRKWTGSKKLKVINLGHCTKRVRLKDFEAFSGIKGCNIAQERASSTDLSNEILWNLGLTGKHPDGNMMRRPLGRRSNSDLASLAKTVADEVCKEIALSYDNSWFQLEMRKLKKKATQDWENWE